MNINSMASSMWSNHVVTLIAVVLVCCPSASLGASIGISNDFLSIKRLQVTNTHSGPSVHHFARHVLCRDIQGKIRFYNAMAKHLCELSVSIKLSLVLDLCERRDHMLDEWVTELYDSDGDGYISHHERTYFDD